MKMKNSLRVPKMGAMGGGARSSALPNIPMPKMPSAPNFMERARKPGGMKKGGKVHDDAAQDKKLIRSEFKKLEKKEGPGMKRGGSVKKGRC